MNIKTVPRFYKVAIIYYAIILTLILLVLIVDSIAEAARSAVQ